SPNLRSKEHRWSRYRMTLRCYYESGWRRDDRRARCEALQTAPGLQAERARCRSDREWRAQHDTAGTPEDDATRLGVVWIRSLDAEIDHLAITKRDHTESERIDDVSTGMPIDRDECLRTAGQ